MAEYEQAQDFFILEWQANIDPAWAAKAVEGWQKEVLAKDKNLCRHVLAVARWHCWPW